MPESQYHINLTRLMDKYVQQVLKINSGYILLDTPETSLGSKPPLIQGYRPDIYVNPPDRLIIGDAKTAEDWDRRHSHDQYRAYVKECSQYKGHSLFLLAVPWQVERSARARLKYMFLEESQSNLDILVISDMWRY